MSPRERHGRHESAGSEHGPPVAMRLRVLGRVQGVGFRPFVARLAQACQLVGWVKNTPQGVVAHVEGRPGDVAAFRARFRGQAPPAAEIHELYEQSVEPSFDRTFEVVESDSQGGDVLVAITPDLAYLRPMRDGVSRSGGSTKRIRTLGLHRLRPPIHATPCTAV